MSSDDTDSTIRKQVRSLPKRARNRVASSLATSDAVAMSKTRLKRLQERAFNGGNGEPKQKDDSASGQRRIDRKAQLPTELQNRVRDRRQVVHKPYDALNLRSYAQESTVAQAYIDTLAQDTAGASWRIEERHEDKDVDGETINDVESRVRELPLEMSIRDTLEETVQMLLEQGDAAWIKHYYDNGRLAEIVPVDPATIWKKVDEYGIVQGYVQGSLRTASLRTQEPYNTDEVVWFSWSTRPDRHYGYGPIEKALNILEILSELNQKEINDLLEGAPPGAIVDQTDVSISGDAINALQNDDSFDTVKEWVHRAEGDRNRMMALRGDFDFLPFQSGYDELKVLDRTKWWSGVLGAVMKVNPSYAGFDFQNTNRATDESQQQAYQQRGFRVVLRQLEEAINRHLIWKDLHSEVKWSFHREQTPEERQKRVSYISDALEAGKVAAENGLQARWHDGKLVVEDGEIEPPEDGDEPGLADVLNSEVRDTVGTELSEATDEIKELTDELPERISQEVTKDFEADVFRIAADEEHEMFEKGEVLGVGIDFPNSDVYVDWNVDAWGDDDQLGGAHVSIYDSIEDAQKVAQGVIEPLDSIDAESPEEIQEAISTSDISTPTTVGTDGEEDEDDEQTEKDVPEKYSDLDFAGYPEAAQENARMALDARDDTDNPNDCGTRTGWARANQLDNGEELSPDTVRRMAAFRRHQDNSEMDDDEGRADCGWMMWKAWGGDEGVSWAEGMVERMDERDEEVDAEKSVTKAWLIPEHKQEEYDEVLLDAYKSQIFPASVEDVQKSAFSGDEIPDFIRERVSDALDSTFFQRFENVAQDAVDELKEVFEENLTDPEGFNIRDLRDDITDAFPAISADDAETIARTESATALNEARMEGYEARADAEENRFRWVGPSDDRTTELCEELKDEIPDDEGVPQAELKQLLERKSDEYFPSFDVRGYTPHYSCRHTPVRVVG